MLLRGCCWLLFAASLLLAALAWLVSPTMAESWAVERAGPDAFAQFEAGGAAVAGLWVARFAASAIVVLALVALANARRLERFLRRAGRGLALATEVRRADGASGSARVRPVAGWIFRALLVGWAVLAASHGTDAVRTRVRDWPVYRLHSGQEVLPNISQSNREVIRYLQHSTPDDARILVVSDQKLFFLSYYLLPRRIYHPTHPESEFTIPQAHQQRQLEAYRLSDLDDEYIQSINPDFILEYFEGDAYVDPERRAEDDRWIAFLRSMRGDPELVPEYVVVLRPFSEAREP